MTFRRSSPAPWPVWPAPICRSASSALFNEGITGGRGFIALAAFYFGRNSPARTAFGALLFGFFDAAQIRLQGRGVPAELVQTLPYVIVIVVLTGLGVADWRASRERTL